MARRAQLTQIETGFGPEQALIRVVDIAHGGRKVIHEIHGKTRAVAWSRDSKHFALGGAAFSIATVHPLFELMVPSKGKVIVFEVRSPVFEWQQRAEAAIASRHISL